MNDRPLPLDPGELYRVLAESTQDAIVTIDAQSTVLSVNPAAERLFGRASAELIGHSMTGLMPTRYRAGHEHGMARYMSSGVRHIPWSAIRVEVLHADGHEIPVEISFGEFQTKGRRVFSAILRDVSARVATEAELALVAAQLEGQAVELELQIEEGEVISEELEAANRELHVANTALERTRNEALALSARVTEVLEGLTDAVNVFDLSWRWTFMNAAARAALAEMGRDPDAMIGRTLWAELPELRGTMFESETRRAVGTRTETLCEEYLPALGRWFQNRIVPSSNAVTTFTRDVTAEREAAELVRAREVEYRALANSIPNLAWTARPDGYIDWYNQRWFDYTGTTQEEMEGWGWKSVHHPDTVAGVTERWQQSIAQGAPFEMTIPLRGADGRFRRFVTRVVPVRDAEGRVQRWFGSNTDVEGERSAREEADRAVARTEQLQRLTALLGAADTVGAVAAVVVDEMVTMTGAVTAALFLRHLEDDNATLIRQIGLDADAVARFAPLSLTALTPASECIRTGHPVFLSSTDGPRSIAQRYPYLEEVFERLGTGGVATVPLTVSGAVIGAMSFTFPPPHEFSPAQREFYLAVGGQAAQALERARLRAEREELVADLAAERTRLRGVFEQAPVAVVVLRGRTADELVFEMANPRYLALVPPEPHPVGLRVWDALPDSGSELRAVLERVVESKETVVVQEMPVGVDRDGDGIAEEYYFTATYHPLVEQGSVVGVVAVIMEVTAAVHARREEARLRALAESARSQMEALAIQLQVSEGRFRDAFLQGPAAVAVMDGPEQRYTLVSPAYEAFASQSPLAGRTFLEVFPQLRDSMFDRAHRRVFRTGEPVTLRESPVAIDRDGDGVPESYLFDTHHAPLRDADGAVYAIATVAVDVTEQVQARLEVETARAEAEAASRAKGDFLGVMSHELRTPLNAIGGYVDLLEMEIHGPVTDDQRADLRRIQHSQRHLLGLINELLNFTKLQAGSVVFDTRDVEVFEAIESAEALVVPQARERHLTLTIEPQVRGLTVRADEEKLRQLLVNLLSNAVKFTQPGGAITAGALPDGDRVRLFVRDTGIGIAADQLDRIFEPFTQVRADHTRTAEGTGLGLAISRDLARGMGGELTVESTLGEGSCFTVVLPAGRLPEDGTSLA